MLDRITIAGEATFDAAPVEMSGLSQFNYVFGANGTGKTTLSRVIAKCDAYPRCSLIWKNGTQLETVVYNRDFVSANFHQCDELPGIFTLGEKNAETIRKIADAQREQGELTQKLEELTRTLQGADGNLRPNAQCILPQRSYIQLQSAAGGDVGRNLLDDQEGRS